MSNHILGDRRKALEDQFFARQNEKLRQALRQKEAIRERREALAEVSGIDDDAVLDRLLELGFSSDTVAALFLVPLVEVAWADDHLDEREHAAILTGARENGLHEGSPCYELLDAWLDERPSAELLDTWRGYVQALCEGRSDEERAFLRDPLLLRARSVAESARGCLGLGRKVSAAEDRMLETLAEAFA